MQLIKFLKLTAIFLPVLAVVTTTHAAPLAKVNGKTMQDGNTDTMIFGVKTIVSYLSQCMSLQPGDVIATGTPPGVGQGMNPPVFLKAGDEVETSVAGLGTQKQTVIEP